MEISNQYDKMTKNFKIGEYSFTIGLNREMAVKYFKKQPKYFDCVKKISELSNIPTEFNEYSMEQFLDRIDLMAKMEEYSEEIVRYALPEMLNFGMNDYTQAYGEFAEKIINYCNENDVLYNEVYEQPNGEKTIVKGFFTLVMEFISMGFTHGKGAPKNKKPKIEIEME